MVALYTSKTEKTATNINHHDVTYKLTKLKKRLKKKLKFMKLFIPECSVMGNMLGDEVVPCWSAEGFVTMCIF